MTPPMEAFGIYVLTCSLLAIHSIRFFPSLAEIRASSLDCRPHCIQTCHDGRRNVLRRRHSSE
jgi:hypothetical protein